MRYDRASFLARLQPIIDGEVEAYRADPAGYVERLPVAMNRYFSEAGPGRAMGLAALLAQCLIATHRKPTADYVWTVIHASRGSRERPGANIFAAHAGLRSMME